MSCQLIPAAEWDRMIQSGRVTAAVAEGAIAPAPQAPPRAAEPGQGNGLGDLLSRAQAAEAQLEELLAQLHVELARLSTPVRSPLAR